MSLHIGNSVKNRINHFVGRIFIKAFFTADNFPEPVRHICFCNLINSVCITYVCNNVVVLLGMNLKNNDRIDCWNNHDSNEEDIRNLKHFFQASAFLNSAVFAHIGELIPPRCVCRKIVCFGKDIVEHVGCAGNLFSFCNALNKLHKGWP